MRIWTSETEEWTVIHLEGELDHHAAKECVAKIGKIIDNRLPMKLTLDMEAVSFMDSSGIAVILGVYKRIGHIGGKFRVINLNKQAEKVVLAAGLAKILPVERV